MALNQGCNFSRGLLSFRTFELWRYLRMKIQIATETLVVENLWGLGFLHVRRTLKALRVFFKSIFTMENISVRWKNQKLCIEWDQPLVAMNPDIVVLYIREEHKRPSQNGCTRDRALKRTCVCFDEATILTVSGCIRRSRTLVPVALPLMTENVLWMEVSWARQKYSDAAQSMMSSN